MEDGTASQFLVILSSLTGKKCRRTVVSKITLCPFSIPRKKRRLESNGIACCLADSQIYRIAMDDSLGNVEAGPIFQCVHRCFGKLPMEGDRVLLRWIMARRRSYQPCSTEVPFFFHGTKASWP